jgi:hypothetical protein
MRQKTWRIRTLVISGTAATITPRFERKLAPLTLHMREDRKMRTRIILAVGLTSLLAGAALAQDAKMGFFITSVGSGKGADLGGLEGADKHCQQLAEAAGVKGRTWRAYLSASAIDGQPAVNAIDRIGKGPWMNSKGVQIAANVDELHGTNNLNTETALTEKGEMVNGRGDKPNRHDMLTGSQADGTAFPADKDMTCGNWTKSGADGAAMLGHHDRQGLKDTAEAKSWNSSHPSRGGCSQEALQGTGGDGLFYCFAAD